MVKWAFLILGLKNKNNSWDRSNNPLALDELVLRKKNNFVTIY